jgi:hypothetical protein
MNSVDASLPVGEKAEPQQVPVKHPRWCDRSLCTAPEFVPSEAERGVHYYHRSANLAILGDFAPHSPDGGISVHLQQAVMPWSCTVYLIINKDIHIAIDWNSPLMWAILDEHAEIGERYPALLLDGRAEAARQQQQEATRRQQRAEARS